MGFSPTGCPQCGKLDGWSNDFCSLACYVIPLKDNTVTDKRILVPLVATDEMLATGVKKLLMFGRTENALHHAYQAMVLMFDGRKCPECDEDFKPKSDADDEICNDCYLSGAGETK